MQIKGLETPENLILCRKVFQTRDKNGTWSNLSLDRRPATNDFLKNLGVVNCHTFKDFNFKVLVPQIINKRSENFIYF